MPESIRVLYIIVNYRRADLCATLAQSLLALPGGSAVHVQILDNSESQEDKDRLGQLTTSRNLSVVTPPRNLGFYGGANFGLAAYLGSAPLPDWVVVSNPDIAFPDDDFLTNLLEVAITPNLGALAPDIRLAPETSQWGRGHPQNPLMEERPSLGRMRLLEIVHGWGFLYALVEMRHRLKTRRPARPPGLPRPIHAPHGSAIVFSRNYFERGGTLEHGVFLYGEELFVAEELRLRGLQCLFEPRLKLCHVGGVTTRALGSRRQRLHNHGALRFVRQRYYTGSKSKKD